MLTPIKSVNSLRLWVKIRFGIGQGAMGFQLCDAGSHQRIFRSFSFPDALDIHLDQLVCTLQKTLRLIQYEKVRQAVDEGFGGLFAQISEKIR